MTQKSAVDGLRLTQAQIDQLNERRESVLIRIKFGISYLSAVIQKIGRGYGRNTHFSQERDVLYSETIFLADRDQIEQDAQSFKLACELVAEEEFSLEKITQETDFRALDALYEQISSLETIHFNQLISLDHQAGKPFEEQIGLARMQLIKFFIIKKKRCILEGIKFKYIELDKHLVSDEKLRLDYIQREMRQLSREAFALCAGDTELLENFKTSTTAMLDDNPSADELPTQAPELYKTRENRKEKPPEFIKRVYGEWLGKGLLRPHIKQLDLALYQNFYRQGVPEEFDTLLPKAGGRSPENISRSALDLVNAKRESSRRSVAKRREAKKRETSPH